MRRSWRLLIRWSSLDFCKVWYLSIAKPRTDRSDYCLQCTTRSATYILPTKEFTTALLHAENVQHLFWYKCVFPGDGPIRTETCSSRYVVILIKFSAFVGVMYGFNIWHAYKFYVRSSTLIVFLFEIPNIDNNQLNATWIYIFLFEIM